MESYKFLFVTLKAMQELGYPQPQSYSLVVWGQWCHHNFLSSSSWALFQQCSPRPESHTVYPEGPVPFERSFSTLLAIQFKMNTGFSWLASSAGTNEPENNGGPGRTNGRRERFRLTWAKPARCGSHLFFGLFQPCLPWHNWSCCFSVYKLMMISSHKNNTCGLKSQQGNTSDLNPPKKETPPELTGYSQRDRVCICKTIIIFSILFGDAKMVAQKLNTLKDVYQTVCVETSKFQVIVAFELFKSTIYSL